MMINSRLTGNGENSSRQHVAIWLAHAHHQYSPEARVQRVAPTTTSVLVTLATRSGIICFELMFCFVAMWTYFYGLIPPYPHNY